MQGVKELTLSSRIDAWLNGPILVSHMLILQCGCDCNAHVVLQILKFMLKV
jgi:hypothetical protein